MWERKNQPKLFIKNNYIHQADGAPEPRSTMVQGDLLIADVRAKKSAKRYTNNFFYFISSTALKYIYIL
jgi:hypothetical protein